MLFPTCGREYRWLIPDIAAVGSMALGERRISKEVWSTYWVRDGSAKAMASICWN
jgi:hypothetical protein